ncbi:hypothetical protein ES703_96645 [subsurface metagenome]
MDVLRPAKVGRGGAMTCNQAVFGLVIIHLPRCLGGNLSAPFGVVGHLVDMLIFNL